MIYLNLGWAWDWPKTLYMPQITISQMGPNNRFHRDVHWKTRNIVWAHLPGLQHPETLFPLFDILGSVGARALACWWHAGMNWFLKAGVIWASTLTFPLSYLQDLTISPTVFAVCISPPSQPSEQIAAALRLLPAVDPPSLNRSNCVEEEYRLLGDAGHATDSRGTCMLVKLT